MTWEARSLLLYTYISSIMAQQLWQANFSSPYSGLRRGVDRSVVYTQPAAHWIFISTLCDHALTTSLRSPANWLFSKLSYRGAQGSGRDPDF